MNAADGVLAGLLRGDVASASPGIEIDGHGVAVTMTGVDRLLGAAARGYADHAARLRPCDRLLSGARWTSVARRAAWLLLMCLAVPLRAADGSGVRAVVAPLSASDLKGIESRIDSAFERSLRSGSAAPLQELGAALDGMKSNGPQEAYRRGYWSGYQRYREAIVHTALGGKAGARQAVAAGIETLRAVSPSDREVQILLGLMSGLNLQFVPPSNTMKELDRLNGHIREAMKGEPSLRALYLAAISDWNTPAAYGGKRRAEPLLRQALALPVTARRPLSPNWGREDASTLLREVLRAAGKDIEAERLQDGPRTDR